MILISRSESSNRDPIVRRKHVPRAAAGGESPNVIMSSCHHVIMIELSRRGPGFPTKLFHSMPAGRRAAGPAGHGALAQPVRPLANTHTNLNKIGWPSQQSGNKKIAERSKCVYVQSTQCNLGVTYPSHSVQICRSNKTILNRQRTSSCRTLHCPSCPMMDSPRLTTLQAD
jgi:hypothetical protein